MILSSYDWYVSAKKHFFLQKTKKFAKKLTLTNKKSSPRRYVQGNSM